MKNFEKYKTAEERCKAFNDYCVNRNCDDCPLYDVAGKRSCGFAWLDLEAEEEKPLQCPFCGGKTATNCGHLLRDKVFHWVDCVDQNCMYQSGMKESRDEAIAAHNRVCRAVMDASKEGGGK